MRNESLCGTCEEVEYSRALEVFEVFALFVVDVVLEISVALWVSVPLWSIHLGPRIPYPERKPGPRETG